MAVINIKIKAITEDHAKKFASYAMALVQLDQVITKNITTIKLKNNKDQVIPEERFSSHQVLSKLK